MTLREREEAENLKIKNKTALFGKLALGEAKELS